MASVTVNTYDKGSVVRIEANCAVSGVATNPTLSTLVIEDPAGTETNYTIANGGLTNPSVGLLRRDHDLSAAIPGEYWYGFTGTGAAQVYAEGRFYVRQRQVA
jgi:hypothetical protein